MLCVAVPTLPRLSVTVTRTVCRPPVAKAWVICSPSAVVPSPNSQTMPSASPSTSQTSARSVTLLSPGAREPGPSMLTRGTDGLNTTAGGNAMYGARPSSRNWASPVPDRLNCRGLSGTGATRSLRMPDPAARDKASQPACISQTALSPVFSLTAACRAPRVGCSPMRPGSCPTCSPRGSSTRTTHSRTELSGTQGSPGGETDTMYSPRGAVWRAMRPSASLTSRFASGVMSMAVPERSPSPPRSRHSRNSKGLSSSLNSSTAACFVPSRPTP